MDPRAPNIVSGKRSPEELAVLLDSALARKQAITFVTYYLSDYGEKTLHAITARILSEFQRPDLLDIVYTCMKELVMNATKANLKRVVFDENGIDPMNADDYARGMVQFKSNLPEKKLRGYKEKFKERRYPVTVTFYYEPFRAVNIKIKNMFTLLPEEERRIREKFRNAQDFTDLMQFYLSHGDETEGAGMGLTLVGILLAQIGIDRHQFSLYSSETYKETIARLEIPLTETYESRRARFEREWRASGLDKEEFRRQFARKLR